MTRIITKSKTLRDSFRNNIDSRLARMSLTDFEDKSKPKFSDFASIYPFTTENLAGYLPLMDMKNKSVLTIGGSGDHIINAFFFGSSRVCAFDINILAELYSELKFSAIEKLSFNEYKDFFLSTTETNTKAMDFEVYKTLRPDIGASAKIFFDRMFENTGNDGQRLRNSPIFHNSYNFDTAKIKSNTYLHSEENYNIAKKSMPETVKWINASLPKLSSRLDEKFDIILLSNIADYAHNMFPGKNPLEMFTKKCIRPLLPYLNENGIICAAYLSRVQPTVHCEPKYQLFKPEIRKEIFQALNVKYSEHYIDGQGSREKDVVVMLQK